MKRLIPRQVDTHSYTLLSDLSRVIQSRRGRDSKVRRSVGTKVGPWIGREIHIYRERRGVREGERQGEGRGECLGRKRRGKEGGEIGGFEERKYKSHVVVLKMEGKDK